MNSVHEQCPKSDSEIVLSPKQVGCTKCTACWPSSTPRCAHTTVAARPYRRPGGRVVGLSCRGLASWPCRDTSACPSLGLLSEYTEVYCDTKPSQTSPFCHNTVNCIAIQFLQQPDCLCHDTIYLYRDPSSQASPSLLVTIHSVYCDTILANLYSQGCNTIKCIAIQFSCSPFHTHYSCVTIQ